ncbi:subtilisin-like protease SBT4.4 [Gossypium raimondii]|uniref:subtilisin-like protease SBT4.4 n=1 Tax=Gossypium raimondii TaxID=29730 RepID=UPI00063A9A06|nr:subtilisin-like protease SBT4.4 [Gossypium raimondii]
MAMSSFLLFVDITVILMLCISLCHGAVEDDRKVYIAYLGAAPDREDIATSQHSAMLQSLSTLSSVENYLIKSYKRSFNGFAAKLTNEEAKKLASFKEVVSVFPSKVYHLQTTRSWDFLGLNQTVKRNATAESNVIVGVLDSGIWPELDSFSDEGFGPPPKKWKGACKGGQNFTCNNKLIGARAYHSDSARDMDGHGTHTASTAAGNNVVNASFYGLAEGIARGGVPSARIAAYKVCDDKECTSEDILAGFDDAIADGVDLISVSLGLDIPVYFYQDSVAIGAFHAAEKGVLVMQSAGNSGTTGFQFVSSVAPWILSVAASTTDRLFVDKVVLGNGWKTLTGLSVNSFSLNRTKVPLVYGLQATSYCNEADARACHGHCLNKTLVKNKIVLCDEMDGVDAAYDAGALGVITKYDLDDVSFVVPLPAITLSSKDYDLVISYFNSTKEPKAEIFRSETIKDKFAPKVASFSSRGPNAFVPDILKPDISAPGVDILAAYSPVASPSTTTTDTRRVKYNIISGTSMSCPHVAGVAAYVKTFHPHWSPSAIKSALMTTAFPMDAPRNQGAEFAYGSGHINPVKAIDPGLVYDTVEGDNIRFLCSIGYDEGSIKIIAGNNTSCPKNSTKMLPRDFNYPTLTALVPAGKPFKVTFHRTVTNVGAARSAYNATIAALSELEIKVVPQVLSFKSLTEKMSYKVTVSGKALGGRSMVSATLIWSDDTHDVRNPVVIHTYEAISGSGAV